MVSNDGITLAGHSVLPSFWTYLTGRIASFCSGEHEHVCTLVFDIRRIYLYVTDRI